VHAQAALFSFCETWGISHARRGENDYFSELLIDVNLSLSVPPKVFTIAIIASEIPAAIKPYSMAVAPDSSDKNFKILHFKLASWLCDAV
jgi:hypothetical protein